MLSRESSGSSALSLFKGLLHRPVTRRKVEGVGYDRHWFRSDHPEMPEAPKTRACFPVLGMLDSDSDSIKQGNVLLHERNILQINAPYIVRSPGFISRKPVFKSAARIDRMATAVCLF